MAHFIFTIKIKISLRTQPLEKQRHNANSHYLNIEWLYLKDLHTIKDIYEGYQWLSYRGIL